MKGNCFSCFLLIEELILFLVPFDLLISPHPVLSIRLTVNHGAISMKGYSTFPQTPRLKPHHHIVYCHIRENRWWRVLPRCRNAVGVFYNHSRRGCKGIGYILSLIYHFAIVFFKKGFGTQLYSIKYSDLIHVICTQLQSFKYFYLIQKNFQIYHFDL